MKTKYIVIPDPVISDESLNPLSQILFGHIAVLAKKEGYCWADNEHLASLIKVIPRTVQRYLRELREAGYIIVKVRNRQRVITLSDEIKWPRWLIKEGVQPTQNEADSPQDVKFVARQMEASKGGESATSHNNIINNEIEDINTSQESSNLPVVKPAQKESQFPWWEAQKAAFLNNLYFSGEFAAAKHIAPARLRALMEWFVNDLSLKDDRKEAREIQRHFTNWFNRGQTAGWISPTGEHKQLTQSTAINEQPQGRQKTVRELETERFFESLNNPK